MRIYPICIVPFPLIPFFQYGFVRLYGNSWKWYISRRYFAEWIIRIAQSKKMSREKSVVTAEMSRSGASGKRMNLILINMQEKHNGYAPRERGRSAKYSCNNGWTS